MYCNEGRYEIEGRNVMDEVIKFEKEKVIHVLGEKAWNDLWKKAKACEMLGGILINNF